MKPYALIRDATLVYCGKGVYRLHGVAIHPLREDAKGLYVQTTPIIRKDWRFKEFETQNTIYRVYDWSKKQREEWDAITARACPGPVVDERVSQRIRGKDSGGSDGPASAV